MSKQQDSRSSDEQKQTTRRRSNSNRRRSNSRRNDDRRPKPKEVYTSNHSATDSLNDISWYAKYPELLASAASAAFPMRPGMVFNTGRVYLPDDASQSQSPVETKRLMQGVMRIYYAYTPGMSGSVTSPASITAAELYKQVRNAFSGGLDEDAPDLYMYVMAIDQIYAYIAYLKRLYRTVNSYSPNNYLTPAAFFEAMAPDFDQNNAYDDFVANKVQLWGYINQLIRMMQVFVVPDNMDIFNRHRWMNENVYLDIPDMMGQAYVFTPEGFFKIDDTHVDGTALRFAPLAFNNVETAFNYGRELIEALSNWGDAYTINGHIQRAFEGVNRVGCELLGQDEVLEPVFVPEVLMQIHNIKPVSFAQASITQDPNTNSIIWEPVIERPSLWDNGTVIDMDSKSPTPAEVTIATRLTATLEKLPNVERYSIICGTEVVKGLHITIYQSTPNVHNGFWAWASYNGSATFYEDDAYWQMAAVLSDVIAWDHFPIIPVRWAAHNSQIGTESGSVYLHGQITNPTFISNQFLRDLHRVCTYSEYNCFAK